MAIEIVDFPIKNGDFPWQNVSSPEGIEFEYTPCLALYYYICLLLAGFFWDNHVLSQILCSC